MQSLWTGHITFGLISIPVSVHSAIEASEKDGFRLFHRKDMAPIRYKKFCSKEDVEVPADEIVKGHETARKRFAIVEKDELEKVLEEAEGHDRSIDVLQFVALTSLNPLSFDRPYYLAPTRGGEKAYGVLRDALLDARRVGIARVTFRAKPSLAALLPDRKVLSMEILRPFEELRSPADLGLPVARKGPAEVRMARLLIDQMSAEEWDPTAFPSEYKRALRKLLAKKRTFGVDRARETEAGKENVVDLMEALRKSVARGPSKGRSKPAGARRGAA